MSSVDEDDHDVTSVVATSVDDDNHDITQLIATSVDDDSSSYGNEDVMTTAKMETHTLTTEIVFSGSEDESEMKIFGVKGWRLIQNMSGKYNIQVLQESGR